MEGDPAVHTGVLVHDVYEVRGFPGDALPGECEGGGAVSIRSRQSARYSTSDMR
jgi:hypothetical protein